MRDWGAKVGEHQPTMRLPGSESSKGPAAARKHGTSKTRTQRDTEAATHLLPHSWHLSPIPAAFSPCLYHLRTFSSLMPLRGVPSAPQL